MRTTTSIILAAALSAILILGACATGTPGEPSPWRDLMRQAIGWGVICALQETAPFEVCLLDQARGWFDTNAGGLLDEWLSRQDLGLDPEVVSALARDLASQLLSCALGGQPESCLREWASSWAAANAPQLADLIGTLLDRLIFGPQPQVLRLDRFSAELAESLPVWIATCGRDAGCVQTVAEGWAGERFPGRSHDAGKASYELAEMAEMAKE